MSENPYAPPTSETVQEPSNAEVPLASRLSRLGAAIIDAIIMTVVTLPIAIGVIGFQQLAQISFFEGLGVALVSIAIFFAINFKFLKANGQTVGKKLVKIRIVDEGGNVPDFNSVLTLRYGFYFLLGQIPGIGGILSLINVLFIFRKDQRCLHDLVAKTNVVVAEQ